jgi:hypothetical protein
MKYHYARFLSLYRFKELLKFKSEKSDVVQETLSSSPVTGFVPLLRAGNKDAAGQ